MGSSPILGCFYRVGTPPLWKGFSILKTGRCRGCWLLTILLLAAPARAEDVADVFSAAVTAYKERKRTAALEGFLQVVAEDPAGPHADKALQYIWSISSQVKKIEERLRHDPDRWGEEVKFAREQLASRRREADSLLKDLRVVAEKLEAGGDPLGPLRGTALDPAAALNPEALDEWSRAEARRYLEAIRKSLDKAVASPSPAPADLYEAKGYHWLYEGDLELAIAEWEKAVQARPGDADLRGRLSALRARWDEQRRREKVDLELTLGLGELKLGRAGEALARFRKVLELDPEHAEAQRLAALAENAVVEASRQERIHSLLIQGREDEESGRTLEAIQQWVDILTLDPQNKEARRSLERARKRLLVRGETPPPAPTTTKARPSAASRRKAEEAYSMGLIQYSDGDLEGARRHFQEALRQNPDFTLVQKALEQVETELKLAR